jgi:hypothetical protein
MAELTKSDVLFTTFVACTYDGIAFPMTHLASSFNMQGSFAQRPSIGDLPPTVTSARITFPLLLLAAQTLPKNSALSLVRINMPIQRLNLSLITVSNTPMVP